MPDKATGEALDRWLGVFGKERQFATTGSGFISLDGDPGTVIPQGTLFSSLSGNAYGSAKTVSLPDPVCINALEPGTGSNLVEGQPVSMGTVIPSVQTGGQVVTYTAGTDDQCDDDARKMLLDCIQSRCRYGALKDYESWAREVGGVTRAWASTDGCTVKVYFAMDGAYPEGVPQGGDVAAMQNYLSDDCRKPTGATVEVCQFQPETLCVIVGCPVPFVTHTFDTIQDELERWLIASARPGQSIPSYVISGVINSIPGISADISPQNYTPASDGLFTSVKVSA